LAVAGPHLSVLTSSEWDQVNAHMRTGHVERWNMSRCLGRYGVGNIKAF